MGRMATEYTLLRDRLLELEDSENSNQSLVSRIDEFEASSGALIEQELGRQDRTKRMAFTDHMLTDDEQRELRSTIGDLSSAAQVLSVLASYVRNRLGILRALARDGCDASDRIADGRSLNKEIQALLEPPNEDRGST